MKVKVLIKHDEILRPIDHVGGLFYNNNGVFSILDNLEDILKGRQYFGIAPVTIYFTLNGYTVATTNKNITDYAIVNIETLRPILQKLNDAHKKDIFVDLHIETIVTVKTIS